MYSDSARTSHDRALFLLRSSLIRASWTATRHALAAIEQNAAGGQRRQSAVSADKGVSSETSSSTRAKVIGAACSCTATCAAILIGQAGLLSAYAASSIWFNEINIIFGTMAILIPVLLQLLFLAWAATLYWLRMIWLLQQLQVSKLM